MSSALDVAGLDAVLAEAVARPPGLAGVTAAVTARDGILHAARDGHRVFDEDATPMTTDTVLAIFSCTKAVTAAAAMQCVELGLIDLDAPAATYVPEIDAVQVLDGFDDDGTPRLRPPIRPVTTRMLLLHTAGFGYEFLNEAMARNQRQTGLPDVSTATRASLMAPLLFDPGDDWLYGIGMDWCGLVVEAVRGRSLGEVFTEHIFGPCGMHDTAFALTPSMRERRATVHQRKPGGELVPVPGFEMVPEPEVQMGGQALYSTVGDLAAFLRMYLNDGVGDHGRVLAAETVRASACNGLGDLRVRPLPGVNPRLSHDLDLLPGVPTGWGFSFLVNEAPTPTGRAAGSLAWAGLANVYYWIDRSTGIAGIWATQLLPFLDPTARAGFAVYESLVYRTHTE